VSLCVFRAPLQPARTKFANGHYQEQIEEIQRQRFDRAANKYPTHKKLVQLGHCLLFSTTIDSRVLEGCNAGMKQTL
jgi:hypothetical protein